MNPHSVSQGVKFINDPKESSQDCVDAYHLMEEFYCISLTFKPPLLVCDLAMAETLNATVYWDQVCVPL